MQHPHTLSTHHQLRHPLAPLLPSPRPLHRHPSPRLRRHTQGRLGHGGQRPGGGAGHELYSSPRFSCMAAEGEQADLLSRVGEDEGGVRGVGGG